jgi:hypothetical protein
MSKKDFQEYIKKSQARAGEGPEIDWGKKRDEWLDYLKQFYQQIQAFLKDYAESGDLSIEFHEKSINEELIGEYKADSMTVKLKGDEVVFDPIGTNLIGAKGRVDMKGSAGTVKFVLVNKHSSGPRFRLTIQVSGEPVKEEEKESADHEIEWDWKIATPPPRIKYIELDEDSFFDSLMEAING